jgi:hypothetical protein
VVVAAARFGNAHGQVPDPASQAGLDQRMRDEMDLLRELVLSAGPGGRVDLAGMESFLSHMPGRYRIEGIVKDSELTAIGAVPLRGKVTGVADCRGVGEGPGVDCILTATWRDIGHTVATIGGRESGSEQINTFRPAVLVLGVEPNPTRPRMRALLVVADGFSYGFTGQVADATLDASLVTDCLGSQLSRPDPRCFRSLSITGYPEDGSYTFRLSTWTNREVAFTLHPDENATLAEKPKPSKKR